MVFENRPKYLNLNTIFNLIFPDSPTNFALMSALIQKIMLQIIFENLKGIPQILER